MSSIAELTIAGFSATAEGYLSTLLSLEDNRTDSSLLATVTAVAVGLVGTPATGAPGDCLTLFDLDDIRTLLARYRI